MPESHFEDQFTGIVRVQQIIVVAMVIGCLTFAAIAVATKSQAAPAGGQQGFPLITCMALAALVPDLFAFFVARGVVAGRTRRAALAAAEGLSDHRHVDSKTRLLESADVVRVLLQGYQSRLIIGAALLEGVTFFLLIAYFVEGHWLALGAAGALILGILLQFPTRARVAAWILRQVDSVHDQWRFS